MAVLEDKELAELAARTHFGYTYPCSGRESACSAYAAALEDLASLGEAGALRALRDYYTREKKRFANEDAEELRVEKERKAATQARREQILEERERSTYRRLKSKYGA